MQLSRIVRFAFAATFEAAINRVQQDYSHLNFTHVDTTSDYNQNKWLGQELSHTLIYFDKSTTLNNLLSLFGCISGGAVLYVVAKHGENYGYFYREIFIPTLQRGYKRGVIDSLSHYPKHIEYLPTLALSGDNYVAALDKKVQTQPVVHVVGVRGAGKSTLLGVWVKQSLTTQRFSRVIICSLGRLSSANTLRYLQDVSRETWFFSTPTQLLPHVKAADCIIIDEAATLPKQLIDAVVQRGVDKKIILATTIEGYEGTGQSYRLNYIHDSKTVLWLAEPKRFSLEDPLYQFGQRLMQSPLPSASAALADGVTTFDNQMLAECSLTQSVFALLREAHYKTTPNDLMRFYDAPARFAVYGKDKQLLAALYSVPEKIPQPQQNDAFYTAVIQGKRRMKDAMTQQSILAAYGRCGYAVASANILRISRIATATKQRRQGYATQILQTLEDEAKQENVDFMSTSFAANPSNVGFWLSQDFLPIRLSTQANKWANSYALLMLKPLTTTAIPHVAPLAMKFYQHCAYYQKAYQNDTAACFINDWAKQATINHPILPHVIRDELDSVVNYHRDIHWILPTLWQFMQQDTFAQLAIPQPLQTEVQTIVTGAFLNKAQKKQAKATLEKLLLCLPRK